MSLDTHQEFAPVVALTIVDGTSNRLEGKIGKESPILLAVRDPSTNNTHPNVVSVPTQRIPRDIILAITQPYQELILYDRPMTLLSGLKYCYPTDNNHNPLIFIARSLLASKLGVASSIESREIQFCVQLRCLAKGTVRHPEADEPTLMANLVVTITKGADLFPKTSSSYSHIMWKAAISFLESALKKNPLILDERLNPFEYCVHGMCIMSSYNIVADELSMDPYPSNIYASDYG